MMNMNAQASVPLVPQKHIEDLTALIMLIGNADVIKERLEQLSAQQASLEKIRADSVELLKTARQAHEDSLKAQENLNQRRATLEAREEEVKRAEAAVKAREDAVGDTEKANAKTLADGLAKIEEDRAKLESDQNIIIASNKAALAAIAEKMEDANKRQDAVKAEEARVAGLAAEIEQRLNMIKNAAMGPVHA